MDVVETAERTPKASSGAIAGVHRGSSQLRRIPLAFYAPAALLIASIVLLADHPRAAVAAAVAMAAAFVLLVLPSRVVIGTDGISVRWLGRTRFISREAIVGVTAYDQGFGRSRLAGIEIALKDGTRVKVPLDDPNAVGPALRSAREALDAAGAAPGATSALVLSRRDRSHEAWLSELRAIRVGEGARFRVAAVSEDDLWTVVANPSASVPTRAAAAFALGGASDRQTNERLLRVATQTAEPTLRTFLERASAAEAEEELAQALIELDRGTTKPGA